MDSCQYCKFFFPDKYGNGNGQCKRFPPTILVEDRKDSYGNVYQETTTQQPWVSGKDDWCGEFLEP